MNQACLYHRANAVQRHDAEQIINEFSKKLQWRLDGCDALLDVGSGSGDVLMDFIYPLMPKKFERIVGSDISPKMMSYAKKCYKSYEKCDFKILDIGTEMNLPNDLKEQFDHVTSFYCLHWIQNQRQALKNIFNLLRSKDGDCLLVFLASSTIFDVYKLLSKSLKWSAYMKDVDQFVSPLHYSKDPKLEFSTMLRDAGFSEFYVELKQKTYVYAGLEILKDNVKAICPFLDRIPRSQHEDFMDDFINIVTSLDLRQNHHINELDFSFSSPYNLVIAYAKKSLYDRHLVNDVIASAKEQKRPN